MSVSPLNSPNSKLTQDLLNYRLCAMNNLRGPASASAMMINAEMAKLAAAHLNDNYGYKAVIERFQANKERTHPLNLKLPSQGAHRSETKPFFMKADSQCVQGEATLEGQLIACFEIGGEKRLCLPQIFKTVLSGFSLDHINQACDKLCIYCSRCNPEQLDQFRRTRNLPPTATACGLITMTDAERLCMDLLHSANDDENNYMLTSDGTRHQKPSDSCIPVYHECFGEGMGFFKQDLYCSPNAKCIECTDCGKLFSTRNFVGHSHRIHENGVCHWGFDRKKWRSYLLLAEELITDSGERDKIEIHFNDLLNRFSEELSLESDVRKRKSPLKDEDEGKVKARRFSDSQTNPTNAWMLASPPFTFPNGARNWPSFTTVPTSNSSSDSTAKPRLPTQKSCPPTLEDPERVIPSSETNRYEKHFVPNIALQQRNESQSVTMSRDSNEYLSSQPSRQTSDTESQTCSESPYGSSTHSLTGTDRSGTVTSVLESLARMENMYMQLLGAMTSLGSCDKETMEHKYIACSDTIRKQFLPEGSALDKVEES